MRLRFFLVTGFPAGAFGADYVAKAKPDGYTFLIGAAGVITNSLLRSKMPYADSDLIPVGMIAVAPSVIVVPPTGGLQYCMVCSNPEIPFAVILP